MPLIIGEDRLIPGFEANLVGLKPGESTAFDITFPDDYPEERSPASRCTSRSTSRSCARRSSPRPTTRSPSRWATTPTSRRCGQTSATGCVRNALDRARHDFSDRIIDYAVANSTIDLPDILVDQEVEVMHDEFRATLARQGISEPAYLKATEKTEADLHTEFRPRAEQRVKVLLVLSKIADIEGIEVPDAEVEAAGRARPRALPGDAKTIAYFESERGRNFIRSTQRRSRTVETLVDRWLAAHPDHPAAAAPRGRRAVRRRGPRGRGRRIDRRHRPGLDPRRHRGRRGRAGNRRA